MEEAAFTYWASENVAENQKEVLVNSDIKIADLLDL